MRYYFFVLLTGFILDLIFGDPQRLWHPVQGIGWLIAKLEKALYPGEIEGTGLDEGAGSNEGDGSDETAGSDVTVSLDGENCSQKKTVPSGSKEPHDTAGAQWNRKCFRRGLLLVIIVLAITTAVVSALLYLAWRIHPYVWCVLASVMTWQILAMKSLKTESVRVERALETGFADVTNASLHKNRFKAGHTLQTEEEDSAVSESQSTENDGSATVPEDVKLRAARKAVSRIVGRDTQNLDAAGVTRAAVETVAENLSDGVIAPMLCLAIGGPVFGFFYKAVNTMDSMIAYKNDRYLYFGRAAAKLDDVMNFIPSRLSGLILCLMAGLMGREFDGNNAMRIFIRDRLKHASPNSAQTESAMAGALHLRLAGDASYFGKVVRKPFIGDDDRPIEPKDITRANRLMYAGGTFSLLCSELITALLYGIPGLLQGLF